MNPPPRRWPIGFDRSAVSVLVFRLGGGTSRRFRCCVSPTVFDVKATSGEHQLGGNDWESPLFVRLLG